MDDAERAAAEQQLDGFLAQMDGFAGRLRQSVGVSVESLASHVTPLADPSRLSLSNALAGAKEWLRDNLVPQLAPLEEPAPVRVRSDERRGYGHDRSW